jgi:hypothetical protein
LHGDENYAHEQSRSEQRAADHRRPRRTASKRGRRARTRADAADSVSAPPLGRAAAGDVARVVASAPRPTRRTGPLRVFATVLVVPALVGTVALPAYALMPGDFELEASGTFSRSVAEAQDVEVSSLASGAPVSSDVYSVVTKAELEQARLDAEAASRAAEVVPVSSGGYSVVAERAESDDYPWWYETIDDEGGGLSPLRYYYRECVDFVAWRLNRDVGVTGAPWRWDWGSLGAGSAYSWADAWQRKGWPTSNVPVVGAVAWFPYNHVAYVHSVNADGTVVLEEYNWNSTHAYNRRTVPAADVTLFLYPPA